MDIATGTWFEYLREGERLDEGLYDIGLADNVAELIDKSVPRAPEKAKTYVGNQWKKGTIGMLAAGEEYGREAPGATAFAEKVTNFILDHFLPYPDAFSEDRESDEYKKLVFIIKNINQTVRHKPYGKWKKAFNKAIKNLSALGVDSTAVGELQEFLSKTMEAAWWRFNQTYTEVLAFLQEHPDNYDEIKDMDIDEALGEAEAYFREKENPEQIIHTFPDGSYWYDLQTTTCDQEADRMGHCGSDGRGDLISLRKPKEKRKTGSSSYVTMAYNKHDEIIYQIKGRENSTPPEETWEHINWFVQNMPVTKIEETGEHSGDDFGSFLQWLRRENPGISVGVDMDELVREAQEELDDILESEGAADLENVDIWARAEDPYEAYGYDEADHPVIRGGATGEMQVNLGWPSFRVDRLTGYSPPKETGLKSIPANPYTAMGREVAEKLGITEFVYDFEGETELSWDVQMLTPAAPEPHYKGDEEPAPTAHLMLHFNTHFDADSIHNANLSWFVSEMKDKFEDDYDEHVENFRTRASQAGYATRNIWDKEQESLKDMKLENFQVIAPSAAEISFWLRAPDGQLDNENPMRMSSDVFVYWPYSPEWSLPTYAGPGHGAAPKQIRPAVRFSKELMAGGQSSRGLKFLHSNDKYISPFLNHQLGQELIALNRQAIVAANDPRQTKLMFGDKYKEQPPPPLELANDIQLIIVPSADPGGLTGVMTRGFDLRYRFKVTVNARNSAEEIERVKGFMKFLDDNPKLVRTAAEEVINLYLVEPFNDAAAAAREEIVGGERLRKNGAYIEQIYGDAADDGNPNAEKAILVLDWVKANWGGMDDTEKYVALYTYLGPMANRAMRLAPLEVELEDSGEMGKPLEWNDRVQREMRSRQVHGHAIKGYSGVPRGAPIRATLNEPVPVGESIEAQIERIDRLLAEKDETYDLRIYRIQVDCSIANEIGGEAQETQTEVRGIPGVTTVRSLGDTVRETPQQTFVTLEIKFELIGTEGRVKYRDQVLIPGLMKIRGLKILRVSPIHRTNVKGTIRTVRESFGGGPAGFAPQQQMMQKMKTPRPALETALEDWMHGSTKAYDMAVNTQDMRYTVMMPVKELLPYISREFRAPADAFDGMYQHYIANGPQAPVFVALGKNGRIKITGNEDIVWFAKRAAGEEAEVPVFISYQQQA